MGIAAVISGRPRDIGGGFEVRRLLPARAFPLVGPFIFFDHAGPAEFAPGNGLDVPPHPHIGLATVTYLLEGEIIHRDSLGSQQPIRPGDINWMTAGRGIVHSERTGTQHRRTGSRVNAIQLWVALPQVYEETEPEFHHHPAGTLPALSDGGVKIRVLAGRSHGLTSPVRTFSALFFVDVMLPAGSSFPIPLDYAERAAYVAAGSAAYETERVEAGHMVVFRRDAEIELRANSDCRIVLLGGDPIDGKRHIWWNFVSSSKERIEQARRDWKDRRFPNVPGDEVEFVPLPE